MGQRNPNHQLMVCDGLSKTIHRASTIPGVNGHSRILNWTYLPYNRIILLYGSTYINYPIEFPSQVVQDFSTTHEPWQPWHPRHTLSRLASTCCMQRRARRRRSPVEAAKQETMGKSCDRVCIGYIGYV